MEKLNSQFKRSFFLFSFLLLSCSELQQQKNAAPPAPSPSGNILSEDLNHPIGNSLVVLGADFTQPNGTLNVMPTNPPRTASVNLELTHSDAVLRSFGNLLYIVNRLGGDNIQVVDPENFSTLHEFSTGNGTNPQDIIVLSPTKAYVTLYQPEGNQSEDKSVDDLLIFNPTTGGILKTIDLTKFTYVDNDRFARASHMVIVEDFIYVALQDLPGNLALPPDQRSKLVRVNTKTEKAERVILLDCRNPFSMTYSPVTEKIYIGCSDFFDQGSSYGGVEVVDPATFTTEGIILDDETLGGWVGDIEVSGNYGFVVVGNPDLSVAENKIVRFALNESNPALQTIHTSAGFIQEIAVAPDGLLLIGDRSPQVNGIVFVNPDTGAVVDGPINVGLPPSAITFVERGSGALSSGSAPQPPATDTEEGEGNASEEDDSTPPSVGCDALPTEDDPYADAVVSYTIGTRGGYHLEELPDIVLGAPHGVGNRSGGVDVFSLGLDGEIILEFTDYFVCDGDGDDFIVFENSFSGFFEPAIVSVSEDGLNWYEFPCDEARPNFTGCAGGQPVFANPYTNDIDPTNPSVAGGDSYDLTDVGLETARFVRITDINGCTFYNDAAHCTDGAVPDVLGFDLDAVAVVNGRVP